MSDKFTDLVVSARTYLEKARIFVCKNEPDVVYAEAAIKELKGVIKTLEGLDTREGDRESGVATAALNFFSKAVDTYKAGVKETELKYKQEVTDVVKGKKELSAVAEKIKEEREVRRTRAAELEEKRLAKAKK